MFVKELTLEITNYCPNNCLYCSSNTTQNKESAVYLPLTDIQQILRGNTYGHLIISGGEPLAHPDFYSILELCKKHSRDTIVYTNAITHLIYNQSVIDGVYLEANITVLPEIDRIHILRRVKQGKEANRPEIHLSRNFSNDCQCEHHIVRPTGIITKSPCDKYLTLKESIK